MVSGSGSDQTIAWARQVWAERYAIEMEAASRFGALVDRMGQAGAPSTIVGLTRRASEDELRHAAHCQTIVSELGGGRLTASREVIEYAPASLTADDRLLYEVVAQCCVAETQSAATLVTLIETTPSDALRTVLRELARDEVRHARIGWAYLAWSGARQPAQFLGRLLPSMVEGSAGPQLFGEAPPEADSAGLLAFGILPSSTRRELYVDALTTVILPGFEQAGVPTGPLRQWLEAKQLAVESREVAC